MPWWAWVLVCWPAVSVLLALSLAWVLRGFSERGEPMAASWECTPPGCGARALQGRKPAPQQGWTRETGVLQRRRRARREGELA